MSQRRSSQPQTTLNEVEWTAEDARPLRRVSGSLGGLFTSELSSVASDRGSGAGEELAWLFTERRRRWDLGGNTPTPIDAMPLRHVTSRGLLGSKRPHARQKSVDVFFPAARRENLSSRLAEVFATTAMFLPESLQRTCNSLSVWRRSVGV